MRNKKKSKSYFIAQILLFDISKQNIALKNPTERLKQIPSNKQLNNKHFIQIKKKYILEVTY